MSTLDRSILEIDANHRVCEMSDGTVEIPGFGVSAVSLRKTAHIGLSSIDSSRKGPLSEIDE